MEQVHLNSSQTTKDKLPNNLKVLIESLSSHIPSPGTKTPNEGQLASTVNATEVSTISDTSGDSSINSIGYVADTSELQQHNNNDSPVKNPQINQVAPLTPTTNLKMLVAAASALDRESEEARKVLMNETEDPSSSRKMKSLSLLCKRFLQVADEDIGAGKEFSLEMMASSLGINRRRIYDIINVMEALEMISKQSKNWYLWHGRGNLLNTLAKLKAMIADDPDIGPYLESTGSERTKENKKMDTVTDNQTKPPCKETKSSECAEDDDDDQHYCNSNEYPFAARSVRYDKSLGVLCQKFVMLFLISPDNEVTLEEAGRILVPDYQDDTIYMALNPPVNPKTKVRRLYDIANILTSLGLIEKKVFVGPLHVKKPGYSWSGPSIEEIESVWKSKKQELSKSVFQKMKKPAPPHFFSHRYDIQKDTSPYCSPVKVLGGSRFKRSLSFGGTTTSTPRTIKSCSTPPIGRQSTVLARPLCPKQVDYLREMREFENEMNKHSHRYPHVASVFHEFLQKYQSTLEQSAAANGRFILPKAVSLPQNPVSAPQQDHYPQSQKPAVHHSDAPSSCSCGIWERCVTREGNSNVPIGCGPMATVHSNFPPQASMPQQIVVQTPDMSGCPVTSDSISCVSSNNFVTNLANSILASFLQGSLQNSTPISEQNSIQPLQPAVQPVSTTVAPKDPASSSSPLAEIKNFQEKGTMVSIGQKEGFVHVDELLTKPGSRVRPGNSTLVLESLTSQKPVSAMQELEKSAPATTDKMVPGMNPNAFFTSNDSVVDKENFPVVAKCENGYHDDFEKSPKRQRVN